jgi:hypothetical protein
VPFKTRTAGSSYRTEHNSPIYNWGMHTSDGVAPEYHSGPYDPSVITHKHPSPRGERSRAEDRTKPSFSKSGSNYPKRSGKEAVPNIYAPASTKAMPPGLKRSAGTQSRFGRHSSNKSG